jgi:hypothetical protein
MAIAEFQRQIFALVDTVVRLAAGANENLSILLRHEVSSPFGRRHGNSEEVARAGSSICPEAVIRTELRGDNQSRHGYVSGRIEISGMGCADRAVQLR